jgi:hypothetical protein
LEAAEQLVDLEQHDIEALAGKLVQLFPAEAIDAIMSQRSYSEYLHDPIAFGEDMFGEKYTEDVERLMESVRDYQITIAMSATGTGKTHSAARVASWFYKVHERCQIYTAAAPPLENLQKLLWGEIGSLLYRYPKMFASDTQKSLHIEKTPNDFLTGVTIPSSGTEEEKVSKFSGKHSPNLMFIIDEGDAAPDAVYKGIEGCMSGGNVKAPYHVQPKAEDGRGLSDDQGRQGERGQTIRVQSSEC